MKKKLETLMEMKAFYEAKIKSASTKPMMGLGFSEKQSAEAMLKRINFRLKKLNLL